MRISKVDDVIDAVQRPDYVTAVAVHHIEWIEVTIPTLIRIERLTVDVFTDGNQTETRLHEVHEWNGPLSALVTIGSEIQVVVTLQLRLVIILEIDLDNLIAQQVSASVDTLTNVLSTKQLGNLVRVKATRYAGHSGNKLLNNFVHDYILS